MKETFLTILATASIGFLALEKMQVWTEARVHQELKEETQEERNRRDTPEIMRPRAIEEYIRTRAYNYDISGWEDGGQRAEHFKKYELQPYQPDSICTQ